jgi:hypothetical protein
VFDDGHGPALYVGGFFVSAGGVAASSIAKWNRTSWSALGSGVSYYSGPGTISALAVFDDGSGPALYAGGTFTSAGGVAATGIAKWDGSSWSSVGNGVNGQVWTMTAFDDGYGPALYVGGDFNGASGVAAYEIAKWNGNWSAAGNGLNYVVTSMTVFNDGSGQALYAGGGFDTAGGVHVNHVAKLKAGIWSPLGTGIMVTKFGSVDSLAVFNDGSGNALYVGGDFYEAGGVLTKGIARWNGTSWSAPGTEGYNGVNIGVRALSVFDGDLFAGGSFLSLDGTYENCIAAWNGSHWSAVGTQGDGIPQSIQIYPAVYAMRVFDNGSGPALYVSGTFQVIGGQPLASIAKWSGASWSSLGSGFVGDAFCMEVYDDGSGQALYVGGGFPSAGGLSNQVIAKWDGATLSALGTGLTGDYSEVVRSLLSFDDGTGTALYAAGTFTAAGGIAVPGIARWNGTNWSAVGSGVRTNNDFVCGALTAFDDGSGPALYVATAEWTNPGGEIAKWNGTSWSELGSGLSGGKGPPSANVSAMAAFVDESGPALYVAGSFTSAGGIPVQHIAKWNGRAWSALGVPGDGIPGIVAAMTVFDDGSGPALYVIGSFHLAGHVAAESIAKWSGTTWSPVGGGLSAVAGGPECLAIFNDGGPGPANLYVAGTFDTAGGLSSTGIAEWHGCDVGSFCFGDGSTLECPCANDGNTGHGCNNSASTGGASLQASGTTSPDHLVLTQEGELPSALSIFLQGSLQHGPAVFGNGLRCIGGTFKRLYAKHASSGTVIAPGAGDPSITARSAALGDTISAGSTRVYQVYYRDPSQANCPTGQSAEFNLGNALKVLW